VITVQLNDRDEAMEYGAAHGLAAVLMGFCFVVLLAMYAYRRRLPGDLR
jgi:molybdate transport system permease protein